MTNSNVVYIERLSLFALIQMLSSIFYIWVGLNKKKVVIKFLNASYLAKILTHISRVMPYIQFQQMDYSRSQVQDSNGTFSLPLAPADSLKISNLIIDQQLASNQLINLMSHKFANDRMLAYFRQLVGRELNPVLYNLVIVEWYDRVFNPECQDPPIFFMRQLQWSSYIKNHGDTVGVKVRFYRDLPSMNPKPIMIHFRTILNVLYGFVNSNISRSYKRIYESFDNSSGVPVVAIPLDGNGYTLDLSQNSDLFWVPFADKESIQFLLYGIRRDFPIDERTASYFDKYRFKYIAKNKSAVAGPSVPLWMPSIVFSNKVSILMLEIWKKIKHPHKKLINLDNLKAGTYLGKYPTIVKDTLEMIRKRYNND